MRDPLRRGLLGSPGRTTYPDAEGAPCLGHHPRAYARGATCVALGASALFGSVLASASPLATAQLRSLLGGATLQAHYDTSSAHLPAPPLHGSELAAVITHGIDGIQSKARREHPSTVRRSVDRPSLAPLRPVAAALVLATAGLVLAVLSLVRRGSDASVVAVAAMTGKYAVLKEETPMQDGVTESTVKMLKDRYGDTESKRVVKAWRRMEAGLLHTESHGADPMLVQRCSMHVDGLTATPRPVWDNADIAWAARLEESWTAIRNELQQVIDLGPEGLAAAGSDGWISPVSFGASEAYGPDWRIFNLVERGQWDEVATQLFPETCRLLREAEVPLMEAEFALLPAGGEILPHSDGWNFMLTAHLPLLVPKNSTAFGLKVGGSVYKWKEGEILLFDSSFMHEVYNRTEEDRYVLLLRVWHPELSPVEVQALSDLLQTVSDRSPEGGRSLRDKTPPAEPYTIEIGDDTWKIPAGCNTFDTRVFGPNVVLYDPKEDNFMACQGGTRFYVEEGGEYELRRLESPPVEALPRPSTKRPPVAAAEGTAVVNE